jgi:hypothetical protein
MKRVSLSKSPAPAPRFTLWGPVILSVLLCLFWLGLFWLGLLALIFR